MPVLAIMRKVLKHVCFVFETEQVVKAKQEVQAASRPVASNVTEAQEQRLRILGNETSALSLAKALAEHE